MSYAVNLRKILIVVFASVALTACAAQQKSSQNGSNAKGCLHRNRHCGIFSNWS